MKYTIFLILIGLLFLGCEAKDRDINNDSNQEDIFDFYSCKRAGYPITESYPRQCKTPDGRMFTEETGDGDGCRDLCGDGACQAIACEALGCPCEESYTTCPQDCQQDSHCGNGICEGDEQTCYTQCPDCPVAVLCDCRKKCVTSCPEDCQQECGNQICEEGEEDYCPPCVDENPPCLAPCNVGSCPLDCEPKNGITLTIPSTFSLENGQVAKVLNYQEMTITLDNLGYSNERVIVTINVPGGCGPDADPRCLGPPGFSNIFTIQKGETIRALGIILTLEDVSSQEAEFIIAFAS